MVKTPEEYFADQCLAVPQAADATLSAAEQAFVQKYLGCDALQKMPVQEPEQVLAGTAGAASLAPEHDGAHPAAHKAAGASAPSLRTRLAELEQVQMVSFYIREQIFLLPVSVIVEVLRHMPLTRLPMAPPFIAGVVNLRGKVTPLLHLDALLTTDQTMRYSEKLLQAAGVTVVTVDLSEMMGAASAIQTDDPALLATLKKVNRP